MTSPALTSQLHIGLISHVLQDLSPKAFPKASLTQRSSLEREQILALQKVQITIQWLDSTAGTTQTLNLYPIISSKLQREREKKKICF